MDVLDKGTRGRHGGEAGVMGWYCTGLGGLEPVCRGSLMLG